jgi:hypothetical protein
MSGTTGLYEEGVKRDFCPFNPSNRFHANSAVIAHNRPRLGMLIGRSGPGLAHTNSGLKLMFL